MINPSSLQFEKLDLNGLKILLDWARQEGWNSGPNDAEVFYKTDPDGFYGYFHAGELVAGGAIVSYNGEFGFMGLFIVKPEFRGHGIGRQIWYQRRDKLLSRLKPGAAIGMDGVVAMQPFYAKGGFNIAFRDERYENVGSAFEIDKNITSISHKDLNAILKFDKSCFGFSRPQFLEPWLNLPGNKTFKYVKDGSLNGFAIMRKVFNGYKICPLFALDKTTATELYMACLNAAPEEAIYLDIPLINEGAKQLIKEFDAKYVFECARMYYGTHPKLDMNKVFGITTFELG